MQIQSLCACSRSPIMRITFMSSRALCSNSRRYPPYTTEWDKMPVTICAANVTLRELSGTFFFQHGLTECGISESMEAVGYITRQQGQGVRNDKHRAYHLHELNMCSTSHNLDTPYYLKWRHWHISDDGLCESMWCQGWRKMLGVINCTEKDNKAVS